MALLPLVRFPLAKSLPETWLLVLFCPFAPVTEIVPDAELPLLLDVVLFTPFEPLLRDCPLLAQLLLEPESSRSARPDCARS